MTKPRKVRIFRDRKKSPNWYVEWRDAQGKRHCESCGPLRREAQERAGQIQEGLRRLRAGEVIPGPQKQVEASADAASVDNPRASVVQLRVFLRCGDAQLPLDIQVQLNPQLLQVIGQMAASQQQKILG
jgi:hypothetical protein